MTSVRTSVPVMRRRGGRIAVITAVAGTVLIALGAFWLSFTALADLARRSGIEPSQAWAWPLIVDGIIVVATVAVVALAGQRGAWYPWGLLAAGAIVSVTANALHAVVAADADVPGVLAASVAAVPPLVLLAITHLTVILTRPVTHHDDTSDTLDEDGRVGVEDESALSPSTLHELVIAQSAHVTGEVEPAERDRREVAVELRAAGWSNKTIAGHFDVHPSTVGRWFAAPTSPVNDHERDGEERRP